MSFERDVRDVKIGDLLGRSSASLQAAILKGYPQTFTLAQPFRCKNRICSSTLVHRSGSLRLTFGTQPKLGTWLNVYRTASS
jgi:hypothetical protein